MNTMSSSSSSYGTANTNTNNNEREALLLESNQDDVQKTKKTSSFTNLLLNRKTLALGALAFVSVGALTAVKSSHGGSSSFATLGGAKDTLPHSFSELGKKASSAPLGLRKKNSSMEKVGLLGAMDVHAWPDPFEEVQQVAQEEAPAVEEEATKEEEVKQ
jgi:hypothetical protein